MQFVIGEHGPVVAPDAPDLLEALHSSDLFRRHGALVAGLGEQARVLGVGLELRHHSLESLILRVGVPSHFLKRLERFERLRFEAPDAIIPERHRSRRVVAARLIDAVESNVQNRRTIAFDESPVTPEAAQAGTRHAERQVAVLRIGALGMMARRAGYVLGSRQQRVPEQVCSPSTGNRASCPTAPTSKKRITATVAVATSSPVRCFAPNQNSRNWLFVIAASYRTRYYDF